MRVIGHRGSAGTAPENTLTSFEKAIRAGVSMIELDVHRCQSGELVVIHDNNTKRTTGVRGGVTRQSLEKLQRLDAGSGEKIPTLQEVLARINRRAKVNIELKGKEVAIPVARLIDACRQHHGWRADDFCVSSFDHRQLFTFRQEDQTTGIGILYKRQPKGFEKLAAKLQASSVNVSLEVVTPQMIDRIHHHGLEVWVYTVNEVDDFEKLKAWQADAVFTNFPEKFLSLLP
jgi:glycerophosphoryl diester phosphodiesterase